MKLGSEGKLNSLYIEASALQAVLVRPSREPTRMRRVSATDRIYSGDGSIP